MSQTEIDRIFDNTDRRMVAAPLREPGLVETFTGPGGRLQFATTGAFPERSGLNSLEELAAGFSGSRHQAWPGGKFRFYRGKAHFVAYGMIPAEEEASPISTMKLVLSLSPALLIGFSLLSSCSSTTPKPQEPSAALSPQSGRTSVKPMPATAPRDTAPDSLETRPMTEKRGQPSKTS